MIWASHRPMDAGAMALEQAARNKAANPRAKVFVYRNLVKALPWFAEVQRLLQDQRYWGFFIPYEGCKHNATGEYLCRNNVSGALDASSNLYHDEKQSPGWTSAGATNGGPDGVCQGDTRGNNASGPTQSGYCDCGEGVSCGEYLWGALTNAWHVPQSTWMFVALSLTETVALSQTTGTGRA